MGYEDLPWPKRQEFKRRSASLNKLAGLFGLGFRLTFEGVATAYVMADRCVVPTNWRGEA